MKPLSLLDVVSWSIIIDHEKAAKHLLSGYICVSISRNSQIASDAVTLCVDMIRNFEIATRNSFIP